MTKLTEDSKTNLELVKRLSYEAYPNQPILAELSYCQAILEAGLRVSPPSNLALHYQNLFGIKGQGTAGTISLPTHEFVRGKMITVKQNFAWNVSIEDSIQQHKHLFENGTHDKPHRYFGVLVAETFEEAATEVRKAGYATDPAYTMLLIDLHKKYC